MLSKRKKKSIKILAILAGGMVLFFAGLAVGMTYDMTQEILDKKGSVEISKVIDLYSNTRSPEVSFKQYWEIWNKIKNKYVHQPVDDTALFYGSLEGMVAGLGDPHSIYFPPKKAEEFTKDLAGKFDGIGAEIGLQDGQLTIIAPLPGSPAKEAGLKVGDKILSIDGEDIYGLSLDEAVRKIRGKKGTAVVLTITRDGIGSAQDITIIRDTIKVPTVSWKMKENSFVYLRINYFNETTWEEFDRAVQEILLKSPKGIILDLRSNPGGFLDTSVLVASEWIETGKTVLIEKYNDGRVDNYKANGKERFLGIPTVVLVDKGTASGSEILAGALQDYKLATIVGTTTFGKGSVQDFEVLSDGSALKLTIAEWLTPNDRQINNKGIEPDVVIDKMSVQIEGTDGSSEEDYIDKGMEKALEILKNL